MLFRQLSDNTNSWRKRKGGKEDEKGSVSEIQLLDREHSLLPRPLLEEPKAILLTEEAESAHSPPLHWLLLYGARPFRTVEPTDCPPPHWRDEPLKRGEERLPAEYHLVQLGRLYQAAAKGHLAQPRHPYRLARS